MLYLVLFLQVIYRSLEEHTVLCHFCVLESHLFPSTSSSPKSCRLFLEYKLADVSAPLRLQQAVLFLESLYYAG